MPSYPASMCISPVVTGRLEERGNTEILPLASMTAVPTSAGLSTPPLRRPSSKSERLRHSFFNSR